MVRLIVKTLSAIGARRRRKTRDGLTGIVGPRYRCFLFVLVAAAALALPAWAQVSTEPAKIPVARPRAQSISDYIDLTGNAAAVNSVKLIARVEGFLEAQNFPDGAVVKKGDLLFTIQQDQYKAQLIQAQSQVQAARAALVYARTEVARYSALVKREAASQVDVDHWVFERDSAEAKLLGAQAQVTLAQLNVGYTEVRAPFDGQMGKALIMPGNVVGSPGQQSALAEIVQLDPIYVVANLSEQDMLRIRANLDQRRLSLADLVKVTVDVALQNESEFTHHGTIEYVAPGLDPATGTMLVRGKLANPNRDLMPGFFVRMRLPMGRAAQNALLVPDRALQEDQGGRYLLVVNKDGIVEKRYVQLGQLVGSLRAITAGITADDQVVVGDLWRASPGIKVVPQPTAIEAPRP
jgi:RND family efflux transporter MFP subunit